MRIFITAFLILLLGAGFGMYWLLQSPKQLLRTVEWLVDDFTSLDLELRDPVLDTAQGHISANQIHLYQDDSDGAPLVSIIGFEAHIELWDLLWHRLRNADLKADNVIIYVAEQDGAKDPSPSRWMRYLLWLPASLHVATVHLINSSEDTWIFPLKNLSGELTEPGQYRLRAAADYESEPLDVTLYLYAMRSDQGFRGIQLRGEFHAVETSRLAIVEGELRGGIDEFSYDFTLNAAVPDLAALLVSFEKAPKIEGAMQVRGRIQGDIDSYHLSDAEFTIQNPPAYTFAATGDFTYRSPDQTMLEIKGEGQIAELGYLVDWIDLDLSSLGEAKASLIASGPLGNISVEHFALSSHHRDGLSVNIKGSLSPGALSGKPESGDHQLNVTLSGPNLAVLKQWLGEPSFEPGAWELQGKVSGNANELQVQQLEGRIGALTESRLKVKGGIAMIDLKPPITAASVTGLDLLWEAQAPTLNQLNS